jgi:uncharacterized protein YbdZ (MbtH family)
METGDARVYDVVVNHDEHYSIWPADRELTLGWSTAGFSGDKAARLAYVEEVSRKRCGQYSQAKKSRQDMSAFSVYGAPGRIRTSDPQVRSLVLYPTELRARGTEAELCQSGSDRSILRLRRLIHCSRRERTGILMIRILQMRSTPRDNGGE